MQLMVLGGRKERIDGDLFHPMDSPYIPKAQNTKDPSSHT